MTPPPPLALAGLLPREALTIARIVRVNHAGEFGAIRIYSAQIAVARWRCPDLVPILAEMLGHERVHCRAFRDAMPARRSRPCRAMRFWSLGGLVLGFVTAIAGRQGIWICTAAVEAAVHRHLEDQLSFLSERDPALHNTIATIRVEELAHLSHAQQRLRTPGLVFRALHGAVTAATDAVIWLSTWGDSVRMASALAAAT